MVLNSRIAQILSKVNNLKIKDPFFLVFGASSHQYNFNPIKSDEELQQFEGRFNIQLPEEYRSFLKIVGNGGGGPYYCVEPLENSLFLSLDYPDTKFINNPSLSFSFTDAWNMNLGDSDEDGFEDREKGYFDTKWSDGLLRISNFGCGISMNLVVNGEEYGNIWVDDRCNNNGIYPYRNSKNAKRVGFLDWYESWLDIELLEARD
jgi:SMI1 / KNR4 family (SUKH-1)